MKHLTLHSWIAMGALLYLSAGLGVAVPLSFEFEGYVDFVHEYVQLDESVFVGAPFFGSYVFDPAGAVDEYPNDPRVGAYYFDSAGRMSVQIGNYEFRTRDLGMLIWNNVLFLDSYGVMNAAPFYAAGLQWSVMDIVLGDLSAKALNNDALFTAVPDLALFPDAQRLFLDLPGDETGISGVLTSLTPEPGSLALLGLGATGVALRRRRG